MDGRPADWIPNPAGPVGASAEYPTCWMSWLAARAKARGPLKSRFSDCPRAAPHRRCANCSWPRGRLVASE